MNNTQVTYSFISAADLSAKDGYAVKLNGTLDGVKQPKIALAGAGEMPVGIVYDGGRQSGDEATVVINGICEAALGDTVTVADFLKVDATGRLVTASILDTSDDAIFAQALGSGAVGELIPVLIRPLLA